MKWKGLFGKKWSWPKRDTGYYLSIFLERSRKATKTSLRLAGFSVKIQTKDHLDSDLEHFCYNSLLGSTC
jgi:hypothetical protein